MRRSHFLFAVSLVAAAAPAPAMDQRDVGAVPPGKPRAALSDPDAKLGTDALAGKLTSGERAKARHARAVLKDDPYLREAFGWIDNR